MKVILNTLEVIFSIVFHVLITQSAVINVCSICCFAAVGAVNIRLL